jgi:CheY-like chemotaxis protein
MNGIMGMTELALETDLAPTQRDYLQSAKQCADSLLTILNDILDFSKIEAGKLDLVPTDFSIRDCLGGALQALALRAHQKGLELVGSVDPSAPGMVYGDPVRLRQVLLNLVGNAVKFTDRGEIVVRVEMEKPFDDGVELRFSVCDTGTGVTPEKQAIIFQPFEQADSSPTRKHGGTGLGLAISSQLVSMMQGRIWVESPWAAGCGSAFHFTARFGAAREAVPSDPQQPWSAPENLPVLIIDDNATSRGVLTEMLTRWRMQSVSAESGAAGVAALEEAARRQQPFRLAIVDAGLPDMDGLTVVDRIRQSPALRGTRIIQLTLMTRKSKRSGSNQPDGYVAKPVQECDLQAAIRNILEGNSDPALPTCAVQTPRPGSSLRILVAEDNAVNQKIILRLLERQGHSVAVVGDGKQALSAWEQQHFDLVFMDVQMPEMDGLEVAAAIRVREQSSGRHIAIVALTAHAMKGDAERCLAVGMDAYLTKPVHARELAAVIERLAPVHATTRT